MTPSTLKPISSGSACLSVDAGDFDLGATLESGQVFGFRPLPDGGYEGQISGAPVRLRCDGGVLEAAFGGAPSFGAGFLSDYFDLRRDLSGLYAVLASEKTLAAPLLGLKGLRIIRQDPWEALAGFIISANNNVKRIQGIWRALAERSGGSFPAPAKLARFSESDLRACGLGYRARYLGNSARRVAEDPEGFEAIGGLDYADAHAALMDFPGVGAKVADCVLLYGFQKPEAFPADTWILRVMRKFFFRGRRVPAKKIGAFARRRWGPHTGYVQQYLFHAARKGRI